MIHLPEGYAFTQHSLETLLRCPRRFYLGEVLGLEWPSAIESEAEAREERFRRGRGLHRQIERTVRGLAPHPDPDPAVAVGFERWRRTVAGRLPPHLLPEHTLHASLPLSSGTTVRLLARYDLIAFEPDGAVIIYDWKTGRAPDTVEQADTRMQSVVYQWVLVKAGRTPEGKGISPDAIEMRYWYSGSPDDPVHLRYNETKHRQADARLRHLLEDVVNCSSEADFPPAPSQSMTDWNPCADCIYPSLCQRTATGGALALDVHARTP